MRKNIWIFNHYASGMYHSEAGRHYWFGKYLKEKGYNPIIFTASTSHSNKNNIKIDNGKYLIKEDKIVPFVFVRCSSYSGNGFQRVKNMFDFYKNLFPVSKLVASKFGKPDIIYASSVHPLTLVAGIKIAKKFDIPCICEVRDLWPESIVAFIGMSKYNPIIQALYKLEKWIYTKADRLIFTMEGGYDYIKEKQWDSKIPREKVHYINNGIDVEQFNFNKSNFHLEDKDLSDNSYFKVIYAGSIRKANGLDKLVEAASYISQIEPKIKFIIYGEGEYESEMVQLVKDKGLNNIIFKGKVERKYMPYILSKSDCNLLNYQDTNIFKYGSSQNKLFEYLASGKPIVSNIKIGYSIVDKYKAGFTSENESVESYSSAILKVYNLSKDEYDDMCQNAIKGANDFNINKLSGKLENIIKNL